MKRLYTIGEVAESLGVSSRTVRRLIDEGALPVVWVRRAKRIPIDAVDAFLASGGSPRPCRLPSQEATLPALS